MNELCINALYHSFYGETDELWHKGKMGMHWGRRYYQPYSQGYQAQNKGIFYGTIGKLRGLTSKAKDIGKYYTSGEGGRDLLEGFSQLGKKAKGFADRKGITDTVSQLGSFGKEVGRRAKDTAIPFLREAGSEFGKKTKKGLMTAATYGIYGARELGKMGKEQIERGKTYLDAFSKTGTGQELVSRITAAKKGAKNALDSGINAATSVGASFLSMYLGGPKGRSYEEYTSPKAKTDLAYGSRVLEPINQQTSKKSDTFYASGFARLNPIQQYSKNAPGYRGVSLWGGEDYGSTNKSRGGRERALQKAMDDRYANGEWDQGAGYFSPYDKLLRKASGYSTSASVISDAKKLLNQLTDMSGNRTVDSIQAERSRKMLRGGIGNIRRH